MEENSDNSESEKGIKKVLKILLEAASNLYSINKNLSEIKNENAQLRQSVEKLTRVVDMQMGVIQQMDKRIDNLDNWNAQQNSNIREQVKDLVSLELLKKENSKSKIQIPRIPETKKRLLKDN